MISKATYGRPLQQMAARGLWCHIALVLLGSWAIALSARINVPMLPVPMSMQTFAILLIAALSGFRLATHTLLAYLVQGAIGLPMFTAGAGLTYMTGTTGGYLAGFLFAAALVGWLADRGWNRRLSLLALSTLAGHGVIFLFGVGWLQNFMGWTDAFVAGVLPFIPGLFAKSALVVFTVWFMISNRRSEP